MGCRGGYHTLSLTRGLVGFSGSGSVPLPGSLLQPFSLQPPHPSWGPGPAGHQSLHLWPLLSSTSRPLFPGQAFILSGATHPPSTQGLGGPPLPSAVRPPSLSLCMSLRPSCSVHHPSPASWPGCDCTRLLGAEGFRRGQRHCGAPPVPRPPVHAPPFLVGGVVLGALLAAQISAPGLEDSVWWASPPTAGSSLAPCLRSSAFTLLFCLLCWLFGYMSSSSSFLFYSFFRGCSGFTVCVFH